MSVTTIDATPGFIFLSATTECSRSSIIAWRISTHSDIAPVAITVRGAQRPSVTTAIREPSGVVRGGDGRDYPSVETWLNVMAVKPVVAAKDDGEFSADELQAFITDKVGKKQVPVTKVKEILSKYGAARTSDVPADQRLKVKEELELAALAKGVAIPTVPSA